MSKYKKRKVVMTTKALVWFHCIKHTHRKLLIEMRGILNFYWVKLMKCFRLKEATNIV